MGNRTGISGLGQKSLGQSRDCQLRDSNSRVKNPWDCLMPNPVFKITIISEKIKEIIFKIWLRVLRIFVKNRYLKKTCISIVKKLARRISGKCFLSKFIILLRKFMTGLTLSPKCRKFKCKLLVRAGKIDLWKLFCQRFENKWHPFLVIRF